MMKRYFMILMSMVMLFCACLVVGSCTGEPSVSEPIYYSEFGAKGDGVTDDFDAIVAAHEAANAQQRPVKADAGATYYIGYTEKTAIIQTDTDWGDAMFVIDDSTITSGSGTWIFRVAPTKSSYRLSEGERDQIGSITKGQTTFPFVPNEQSLVDIRDNGTRLYIRKGENANSGADQQEVIVVDKNGKIDQSSPVLWNYERLSSVTIYPMDTTTLSVTGGQFTTIANQLFSNASYMRRGIHITRSNTVIDGLIHNIVGEGEDISSTSAQQTAPYTGFLYPENCVNVTVQNVILTGHRGYHRPDQPQTRRGSYDMQAVRTVNLKVLNCSQTNDITDSTFWGIFASNYAKNIYFDGVKFSRFDAHQGVYNTTIKNSEFGWQCVSIIGSGKLYLENLTVTNSDNFIYFREDYGSTWEGEVEIVNCKFVPKNTSDYNVFYVSNNGNHNFGYACYMPETITIAGLEIDDTHVDSSSGPKLFREFNASHTGNEPFPYATTRTLYLDGLTILSGRAYTIPNNYLRENMQIITP